MDLNPTVFVGLYPRYRSANYFGHVVSYSIFDNLVVVVVVVPLPVANLEHFII